MSKDVRRYRPDSTEVEGRRPTVEELKSLAPNFHQLVGLQRAAGNQATSSLLVGRPGIGTLQRIPTVTDQSSEKDTHADGGGPADLTNLEQDMRDILSEWKEAAKDGVAQFVTNTLSGRLDDLESGSWKTFISSLLGNIIWAAAAFTPVGSAVTAFRISMVGIGVGAVAAVPSRSKSNLPEIQRMGVKYINEVYDKLNGRLRNNASALLQQYPGITRYRALAEFMRASFAPGLVSIAPGRMPVLDKTAVANRFEEVATKRVDTFLAVGGRRTPSEYVVDEAVWIVFPTGSRRLALVRSDFFGGSPPLFRKFLSWIPDEAKDVAIDRWKSHPMSGGVISSMNAADLEN